MPLTDTISQRVFANGLTALVQPVPTADVVAVTTHVRAGYFDEPDEWVGIAHVLEHMFFKGTGRRGPGEIAAETQQLGGYLNAATSYDKTVYFTVLPAGENALSRTIDIQADALLHCALDPAELTRELDVIIQEAKRKLDNPGALVSETLYELLFRVHRMRRWRIGTEAGLRGLTAAAVRSYYESRYTPDRVIVAVTGRVDAEEALDVLEREYGSWARPAIPFAPGPGEPPDRVAALRVLEGDVARPQASIGWRTVPATHDDVPALDVTAILAGQGRGSRLWRQVRSPGLASRAVATHYTPTEVGVFEIGLDPAASTMTEAVASALGSIGALGQELAQDGELDRARALLESHWVKRIETMDGRGTLLCEFAALGGVHRADEWLERVLAVTADDVCRVVRRYLATADASAVLYQGADEVVGLDPAQWPPPGRAAAVSWPVPARDAPSPARRDHPTRGQRHSGGILELELPGAAAIVSARSGSGLVTLSLTALGLRAAETERTAGLTALLVRSALRGAGGMEADALAVAAESLGGAFSAVAGSDAAGWSVTVPAAAARRAAQLLVTVAREPHLDAAEVTRERALLATDAARARDDMFGYPLQRVLREAFPRHHYGLPVLGDNPDRVSELSLDDVRDAAERFRAAPTVLIATGDLPEQALLEAVAEAWADGGSRAVVGRGPAPGWSAGEGVEQRDKAQTALAMAFPADRLVAEQPEVVDVLCALLGGLAGLLFRALREERALAYTVAVSPLVRWEAAAVLTYIATSPEREAEARGAMLGELSVVGANARFEAGVERARSYAAGLVQVRRQRVASWAGELLGGWLHGKLAGLANEPERLRAVRSDQVAAAAEEIFSPDRRAEYVVRGTGKSR